MLEPTTPAVVPVELRLFGPPALRCGKAVQPLRPELPMRLLGLLAASRKPWPRDAVAALFWPEADPEAARRNLRKTLFRLRQWLHGQGQDWSDAGSLLQWRGLSDLQRAQAASDAGQPAQAIGCIGGPLLQGLDGGSPGFQAWLDTERARWAAHWRSLVLQQAAAGQPALQLLPWTARLLDEDPLDEAAARAHALALQADGQLQQARRVHARWRQLMLDELGLQTPEAFWVPPRETAAVFAAAVARGGSPASAIEASAAEGPPQPTAAWPEYLTPLVGRQVELAALRQWAEGPAGLLAVVGPPGCGKTRLAAGLLQALQDRTDEPGADEPAGGRGRRFAFVDADRLPARPGSGETGSTEPDGALAASIAQALGRVLAEGEQQQGRLLAALAAQPTLLVLDSFEHRLADLPVLSQLQQVAGLHTLVTCRVRLPLPAAQELRLDGLPVEPAEDSDALRLFTQRCPSLGEDDLADAATVCRLLQGQPLAIELAARTCRSLAPAELLQTLKQDLAELATHAPDLPPRQRSLRASFEAHWLQLPSTLRRVAARLAVLRAEFSPATARAVAAASDADLAALCDHHALRPASGGQRLHWHPFVREVSLRRLLEDPVLQPEHRAARQALCGHFTQQLRRLGAEEVRPTRSALQYLAREADNLAEAFHQAVALQDIQAQRTLAEGLTLHHEFQARCLQGATLLQASTDPRIALLRARLLHWAAPVASQAVVEEASQALQAQGDEAALVAAARVRALVCWRRGALAEAEAWCRDGLARLGTGAAAERAILLDGLGLVLQSRGDRAAAQAAFTEALAINDAIGNELQAVQNLINLALDARSDAVARACALARRALALCREIGFRHYEPHAQVALSLALTASGQPVAALAAVAEALAQTRASGDRYAESWAGLALAQARAAAGDEAGAREACAQALALAWRLGDASLMSQQLAQAGMAPDPALPLNVQVHQLLGRWGAEASAVDEVG